MSQTLPSSWKTRPLEELCDAGRQAIVDGPFGSNLKRSDFLESGVPVLKIQNIKEGQIVLKKMDFVSLQKANELERHSYAEGDIVMTKLGDPLGISAIVKSIGPGVIVADLVRIRPTSVDTEFLCHQLNSPTMRAFLNGQQKGTTRPRVNLSMVRGLPIAVPPLAEQQRIVEILEEQFSRLDAALASIRTVRGKAAAFRRSLLQAAIDDSLFETGKFESVKLGELITVQGGFAYKSLDWSHSGVPVIRIGNVSDAGIDLEDCTFIPLEKVQSEERYGARSGDILMNLTGATLGAVGQYNGGPTASVNQRVGRLDIKDKSRLRADYLLALMQSPQMQHLLNTTAKGAAQPNIAPRDISGFDVDVPTIEAQGQIMAFVESQFISYNNSLAIVRQLNARISSERRSLLHAAFTGTLTTQWRETHND